MKVAVIIFLLVGALCFTSAFAEESKQKLEKEAEKLALSQDDDDGVLEKVLMKMLVKMQDDKEGDYAEKEGEEDTEALADMQDEEDDDSAQEQDNDEEEGSDQHIRCRGKRCFPRPCHGRRCHPPIYKIKLLARKLISFGSQAQSIGGKLLSLSSTLRRLSSSLGSYGRQLKSLGLSMSSLGRKLLMFHYPYRG